MDENQRDDAAPPQDTLTTRQGHPVSDNQNLRMVGNRGPATANSRRPPPPPRGRLDTQAVLPPSSGSATRCAREHAVGAVQ